MGDNIYLGDRNGVRTPMQWSADRNAGFSRANPQQLYLPVDHRPRVPLRGGQRRGAAGQPALAAVVDEAPDRAAQAAPGVRPRHARVPHRRQPAGPRVRPRARGRARSSWSRTCRASCSTPSSTSTRIAGMVPVELFGRIAVPRDRRAAVPPDARAARLLLVRARDAAQADGARRAARRCTRRGAWTDAARAGARGRSSRRRCSRYAAQRRWFRGKARTRKQVAIARRHRARRRRRGSRSCCSHVEYDARRARDLRRAARVRRGQPTPHESLRTPALVIAHVEITDVPARGTVSGVLYDALVLRRRSTRRCSRAMTHRHRRRRARTARSPAARSPRCARSRRRADSSPRVTPRRADATRRRLRRQASC